MAKCYSCGRELNALNISDVEPGMCIDCGEIALDIILAIGGSLLEVN